MRRLVTVLGAVGLLTGLLAAVSVMAKPSAFDQPSISISGTISGNNVTYSITVRNPGASETLGDIYVAGGIPAGATYSSETHAAGSQLISSASGVASWLVPTIAPKGSVSLSYTVAKGTATNLTVQAFASWKTPSPGTAVSEAATPQLATPRRFCGNGCHIPERYSLWHEAEVRAKAVYGTEHPEVAPSGKHMDNNTDLATCLECHGDNLKAPKSMKQIVHPAHMFSEHFVENYKGNCMTCHDFDNKGEWITPFGPTKIDDKGIAR